METSTKLAIYKRHMAERGVASGTAMPPLWKFLWWRGLNLPPPPFMGFFSLAAIFCVGFGVPFGLGVWLLRMSQGRFMPLIEIIGISLSAGFVFGVGMAAYYRYMGHKHRLGSWAHFSETTSRN